MKPKIKRKIISISIDKETEEILKDINNKSLFICTLIKKYAKDVREEECNLYDLIEEIVQKKVEEKLKNIKIDNTEEENNKEILFNILNM